MVADEWVQGLKSYEALEKTSQKNIKLMTPLSNKKSTFDSETKYRQSIKLIAYKKALELSPVPFSNIFSIITP